MNVLRLQFNPAQPADPRETDDPDVGELRLWLEDETGKEIRNLVSLGGGGTQLARWLRTNRDALLHERVPTGEAGFSSAAEAIARFYAQADPETDTQGMVQRVYDYRTSHGLRFALRGTDTDDIYLGLFRNVHEVSFWGKEQQWRYAANLQRFLDEIELL